MDPPAPSLRSSKRDRTKAALVEAFWSLVDEQGFAAASLDAVARRAGMSRGAIYSNFASRAELLVAAASVRGLQIDRDFAGPAPLADKLRGFAEGLVLALPHAPATQLWHAELLLHIARDPALKAHIAEGFSGMFDRIAAELEAAHGPELAIPAHALALAIQSLAMGFVYQAILGPETVPPGEVIAAFQALARGALRAG
jgi:AcrR family transcriptional regulator